MNRNKYILERLLPSILIPAGQTSRSETLRKPSLRHFRALQRVANANARMREADSPLEFQVARNTGRLVVSLVSHETDKIIRNYSYRAATHVMDRLVEMCRNIHVDPHANSEPGTKTAIDPEKEISHE